MKNFKKLIPIILVMIVALFTIPLTCSAEIDKSNYPDGVVIDGIDYEADTSIYDLCDKLTDDEEATLNETIKATSQKTNINMTVVITDGLNGKDEIAYADDFYDVKYGINTEGVLLLISFQEPHYVYLSTSGYDTMDKVTNSDADSITSNISSYLTDGDVYTAIDKFTGLVQNEIIYNWGKMALISSGVGLIIALIVAGIVVHSYKFHAKVSSTEYVTKNNTNFNRKEDIFIKQYTTKTKIESSSSSGGGGGGSHTSSSGGSHGGGGSSF